MTQKWLHVCKCQIPCLPTKGVHVPVCVHTCVKGPMGRAMYLTFFKTSNVTS